MSDPVVVDCPADVWTLVATNVTFGQLHKMSTEPGVYMQTYRDTGGVAPTQATEGAVLFSGSSSEPINSNVGIDVYVRPVGDAGSVRVDS